MPLIRERAESKFFFKFFILFILTSFFFFLLKVDSAGAPLSEKLEKKDISKSRDSGKPLSKILTRPHTTLPENLSSIKVSRDLNKNKIEDLLDEVIEKTGEPEKEERIIVLLNVPFDESYLDEFRFLGGRVKHTYKYATQGFSGTIPVGQLKALANRLGPHLKIIKKVKPIIMHLDKSVRIIRARNAAWTYGYTGDPNNPVAILDTGIDDSHADLSGKVAGWHDTTGDNSPTPEDYLAHGSHVASTVAGTGTSSGSGSISELTLTFTGTYPTQKGWGYVDLIELPSPGTVTLNMYHGEGEKLTWLDLRYPDLDTSLGSVSGRDDPLEHSWDATGIGTYFAISGQEASGLRGKSYSTLETFPYESVGDTYNLFTGVAPGADLVGVKIFNNAGSGTTENMYAAFDWLIANKETYNIKVASMSAGLSVEDVEDIDLRAAANNVVTNGIVFSISAGNDYPADTINDPALASKIICVGATNDDDQMTDYSSNGPAGSSKPDVVAPGGSFQLGSKITAVDTNDCDGDAVGFADRQSNDYTNMTGTSMSCPHVAGLAALIIQALEADGYTWTYSEDDALRVKMLILMTANETNKSGEDGNSPTLNRGGKDLAEGYGRINADAAIEAVTTEHTGSTEYATLGSSPLDKKVWARKLNLSGGEEITIDLNVLSDADYDLYLYREIPDSNGEPVILASSTSSDTGNIETITRPAFSSETDYIVVKWVSGSGEFSLSSSTSPLLFHDVAVTGIVAPGSVIQGNIAVIDVYVANEGTYTETFDVVLQDTTYATEIGRQNITLNPSESTMVTFNWLTDGELGNHTLEATAGPVSDELDTADNSMSAVVEVTTPPETVVSEYTGGTPIVPPNSVNKSTADNSLGTFLFGGEGIISSITITEYGTCDAANDLENIRLYQDDGDGNWEPSEDTTQLGTTTNFDLNHEATFSGLSLTAGASTYVHVLLDVNTNPVGGETIGVEIASADKVTSTKTVTDGFPVELGTSTINLPVTWTAYNDCAGTNTNPNVTNYTPGNLSGLLKDYATGNNLDVTLTVVGSGINCVGAETPNSGTDAHDIFVLNNIVDCDCCLTYGPVQTFTFTGLDSSKKYKFIHFANRGDSTGDYPDRWAEVVISDVDSAPDTASSAGVTIVDDYTAQYGVGYNTVLGYVAGWTNIYPGGDGDFTVTVGEGWKYYTNALMLQELAINETAVSAYTAGTPDVPPSSVTQGGTAQCLGTFKFAGTGTVSALTITEYGDCDADADLENIRLYEDDGDGNWEGAATETGQLGSTVSAFDASDKASFSFSLAAGSSSYVHVVLDVKDSATITETVGVKLQQAADVTSTKTVTASSWPVQLGTSTISEPAIIVASSTSQPSTIEPSSTDNILGSASISKSLRTGEVTDVTIKLYGTIVPDLDLENVELWLSSDDNWDIGDNQLDIAKNPDINGECVFTETFDVTTATQYLIVGLDVKSGVTEGKSIEIQVSSLGTSEVVNGTPCDIDGTTTVSTGGNTIAFFCDARPGQDVNGEVLLTGDLNQIDDQIGTGWNLDSLQHIGDMDYIAYSGGQNTVDAHQASDVSGKPLFHCVGNHELDNSYDLGDIQVAYDGYPAWNLQPGPTNCTKSTFSYDVGDMHIAVINEYFDGTNIGQSYCDGDIVDELFDWLKSDLRNTTKDYKFVVGHEPAYSVGRHIGNCLDKYGTHRDRFWNLLQTERVMAYMCGHDHNSHLIEHDGVYEADPGVMRPHLSTSWDNFATIIYAHSDSSNNFSFRMVQEDEGTNWGSATVTTKTRQDLEKQILVNTYERAGTESKYWVDYDSTVEGNPDWSTNNSGKWWENAFDDSSIGANWNNGEPGIGFDSASMTGWGWINEEIDSDPNVSGSNHLHGVFQRIPFTIYNKSNYNSMKLKVDYDDALTIWLNGTKIFESDTSPAFDETNYANNFDLLATGEHNSGGDGALAPVFTEINVSDYINLLTEGSDNVVVVANWNGTAITSSDLVAAVRLELTTSYPSISFQDGVYPDSSYAGTRDTYISENDVTTNFGNFATLLVDGDDPSGSNNDKSTLLKWDISSIPSGSTVTAATITINVTNVTANTYQLYEMKRDWTEGNGTSASGADWQTYDGTNSWQTDGAKGANDQGSLVLGSVTGGTGFIDIPLNAGGIALVQSWINSASTNYGIIIANESNTDGLDFDSREETTVSQRPKLTVAYISSDTTPPAVITDLIASTGTYPGEIDISWTAPGDDGNTGTAASYVVKYSTSPIIDQTDFDSAATYTQSWNPLPAGSTENKTLTGLTQGIIFYIAIEAKDEIGNQATLSNTDTNDAMAQVVVLSVSVDPNNWGIGYIKESVVATTWTQDRPQGGGYFSALNDGNATENLNINVNNSISWTAGASPGMDIFAMGHGQTATQGTEPSYTNITTTGVALANNLGVFDFYYFDLQFQAPTVTTDYNEQTIVVTITAEQPL